MVIDKENKIELTELQQARLQGRAEALGFVAVNVMKTQRVLLQAHAEHKDIMTLDSLMGLIVHSLDTLVMTNIEDIGVKNVKCIEVEKGFVISSRISEFKFLESLDLFVCGDVN